MPPAKRLWIGLAAAVSHWALLATIQTGSFLAYLLPAGATPGDAFRSFATIPFLEAQYLVVAILLGAAAWALAGHRLLRWLILPVHVALAAFVLADQLFYKISFDHLRPSLYEAGRSADVTMALSSLAKETDFVFYLAVAIAVAGEAWLIAMLVKAPERKPALLPWGAAAGILLLAGIPAFSSTRYYHLNEHPAIVAALDWARGSIAPSLGKHKVPPPAAAGAIDRDPELAALAEAGRKRTKPPNVLLVVMESVGAVDLLTPEGRPSPIYAPTLARLAERGALFTSVYAPYPASTRSHMALHTGGQYVTVSDMRALEHRYTGPMLGRALQAAGYTTSLFSSERLNMENCDLFLEQGGYDRFQSFDRDLASRDPRNLIHSWGAREEYTEGLMEQWLDEVRPGGKPFYLEYITAATHHPYGTPPGYSAPFAGRDAESLYRNAIHYTDRAIARLLEALERRGLLEDTVIAITGDHGEAFGAHPMNFLHKSFLYEENVRSFLLLVDARWGLRASVRSARVASMGDVMATLVSYVGAPEPSLKGRDLLAGEYETRPVYFSKGALPEQWGLRDGNWKFIAEIRSGKAELYDLAADPLERNNVAGANAERVAQYAARCEDWYLRSDAEYTARLENYKAPGGRALRPEDYRTPGPKLQSTGISGSGGRFEETTRMKATALPVVWNSWAPDGVVRTARWEWTSPTGVAYSGSTEVQGDWTYSYTPYPGPRPVEKGEWLVRLWWEGRASLGTRFRVE
jgi:arylsulfatase A-like enzyme